MTETARKPIGSICQIGDGVWRAALPLPKGPNGERRNWATTSRTKDVVIKAMDAKRAELIADGIIADLSAHPVRSRKDNMAAARELGTHTPRERKAMLRSRPDTCPYCDTKLDAFNYSIDHRIPVARGGSDAIDNMQVICWECNFEKRNTLDWTFAAAKPRPYKMTAHSEAFIANSRASRGLNA